MTKRKKSKIKESTRKKISKSISKSISEGKSVPKKSVQIIKTRYSKKSWYHSTKTNEDVFADSLAERYRMVLLDNDPVVKRWTKKHGIRVPYLFQEKSHYCVPDFLIELTDGTIMVEEIKGRITQKELTKKKAIENYCIEFGYKFNFITTKVLDKDKGYSNYIEQFKKRKSKKDN